MEQFLGLVLFLVVFLVDKKSQNVTIGDVTIMGYTLYKKSINSVTISTVIEIGHF